MDANWLFVGNALCLKETNKEKLDLTSKFWVFFTFQQGLAPS